MLAIVQRGDLRSAPSRVAEKLPNVATNVTGTKESEHPLSGPLDTKGASFATKACGFRDPSRSIGCCRSRLVLFGRLGGPQVDSRPKCRTVRAPRAVSSNCQVG
jgi:hypothetical protein